MLYCCWHKVLILSWQNARWLPDSHSDIFHHFIPSGAWSVSFALFGNWCTKCYNYSSLAMKSWPFSVVLSGASGLVLLLQQLGPSLVKLETFSTRPSMATLKTFRLPYFFSQRIQMVLSVACRKDGEERYLIWMPCTRRARWRFQDCPNCALQCYPRTL